MNIFNFAGFIILGSFLITNVHSIGDGLRNRKLKSNPKKEEPAKGSCSAASKTVTYPGGYPGAYECQAPPYPYEDPDYFDDNNDSNCCGCGKKKTVLPYPYAPYGPIGKLSPSTGSKGTDMIGFAQQFGTTGGQGGKVVKVNTLGDLIKYVGDSSPRVLMISSDITAPKLTKVLMGSSKSIIGSNGKNKLHNIYLRATPITRNIIFQGLTFVHSPSNKGNDDIQLYLNHGKAYWIDHCSFVGHAWSVDDGSEDKLLYIGEDATGATISNCYFGNHRYGLIFGHPADDVNVPAGDHIRVTIHNNRFENLYDRAPGLFRFGQYHVYNNRIIKYGLGFTVATGGSVISENNYFGNGTKANNMLDDKGSGEFIDIGSTPHIPNQRSPKPTWRPSYRYSLGPPPNGANMDAKNVLGRFTPSTFSPHFHPQLPPSVQTMNVPNYPALP